MTEDFATRAELVHLRVKRLCLEATVAAEAGDLVRLDAIADEVRLLYGSMITIREEQLLASMRAEQKSRRRWWRRRP